MTENDIYFLAACLMAMAVMIYVLVKQEAELTHNLRELKKICNANNKKK